jgi:DNA invertase Pin-like site-specific DNA recombinase
MRLPGQGRSRRAACRFHVGCRRGAWLSHDSAATRNLGRLLDYFDEHGGGLKILNLGIDTATPAARLIYSIVAAGAAKERESLVERTQPGLAAAHARGRVGGRRRTFTQAQARKAQRL